MVLIKATYNTDISLPGDTAWGRGRNILTDTGVYKPAMMNMLMRLWAWTADIMLLPVVIEEEGNTEGFAGNKLWVLFQLIKKITLENGIAISVQTKLEKRVRLISCSGKVSCLICVCGWVYPKIVINSLKPVWKNLKGHAEDITEIVKEEWRIDSWIEEST